MKKLLVGCATLAVSTLGMASTARADLVFSNQTYTSGTGLGAVYSVTTAHDPGGSGDQDGTEGSCINNDGSFSPCLDGVTEYDNQTGAGNNVWEFDATLSSFGAVVNVAETGGDLGVSLTNLYLNFCSVTDPTQCYEADYTGTTPLFLGTNTNAGTGTSGWLFTLSAGEYADVLALPGNLVTVSGGFQFANGSTSDGNETLYVVQSQGSTPLPVPEPASLTLFGMGLSGLSYLVRRRKAAAAR